jgi:hypothetical protein
VLDTSECQPEISVQFFDIIQESTETFYQGYSVWRAHISGAVCNGLPATARPYPGQACISEVKLHEARLYALSFCQVLEC